MNQSFFRILLLALLLGALIWIAKDRWTDHPELQQQPAPPLEVADSSASDQVQDSGATSGFTVVSSRPAPRPGIRPSAELLEAAHVHLDDGSRTGSCGPYSLLSDIEDPLLLDSCDLLAADLDEAYEARLWVTPLGQPAAVILLFSHRDGYRAFSEQQGMRTSGYAAHSKASQGYTAIWADSSRPDDFAKTLVHELTHLVNRRALGGNLPRWLSEGLADALGDTATLEGIQPLRGFEGAEGQAERLRLAYETDQLQSVERLVALEPGEFDSDSNSYDYEQSTLLVRYLLLDRELAPRIQAYLTDLADGAPYSLELLQQHLGLEWSELDQQLQAWLGIKPRP